MKRKSCCRSPHSVNSGRCVKSVFCSELYSHVCFHRGDKQSCSASTLKKKKLLWASQLAGSTQWAEHVSKQLVWASPQDHSGLILIISETLRFWSKQLVRPQSQEVCARCAPGIWETLHGECRFSGRVQLIHVLQQKLACKMLEDFTLSWYCKSCAQLTSAMQWVITHDLTLS